MKYSLLLAALLLRQLPTLAQSPPPASAAEVPYRYCALLVSDHFFTNPSRLLLDYGQTAPGAVANPEMAEMATNIAGSHSVIDVLNYLSRHGWELVSVTSVPHGGDQGTRYYTVDLETRYLLRRRTP